MPKQLYKVRTLKPSWKKDSIEGYVGGALVIYYDTEESFQRFFKEALTNEYTRKINPESNVVSYEPKYDEELAYTLVDASSGEEFADYWFVMDTFQAFLEDVDFGILVHEYHSG